MLQTCSGRTQRSATDVALPVQESRVAYYRYYDTSAGVLPLKFFRVHRITDELGGQTSVSYGQANPCTRSNLPQGNATRRRWTASRSTSSQTGERRASAGSPGT